ncbi:IS3 family transposase [Bacillus sp. CGMCC 1.60114]
MRDSLHFYPTERFQEKLNDLSPIEYRTQVMKSA